VFNLVENFRPSEEILSLANKTIMRVLPELPALRRGGESPKPKYGAAIAGWSEEKEMWAHVVDVVKGWLRSGVADQEIAVLARSGKAAADCSRELTSAGVPVHGVGLPSVRSAYAYQLLATMTERVVIEDEAFGAVELMDKYEATSEVQEALADDENRDDWERTRAAAAVAEERGARDLAVALKQAADDTTPAPSTRSGVTVTTIHQAKGLEWDAVALVGVDSKTMGDFAKDEEMRRLIHVAITRSRGRLDISWTGARTRWLV